MGMEKLVLLLKCKGKKASRYREDGMESRKKGIQRKRHMKKQPA